MKTFKKLTSLTAVALIVLFLSLQVTAQVKGVR